MLLPPFSTLACTFGLATLSAALAPVDGRDGTALLNVLTKKYEYVHCSLPARPIS